MFFRSKQKVIESQLAQYRQSVADCLNAFNSAIKQRCQDADETSVQIAFDKVYHIESQADEIRRDIEILMYSNSLFPESRGDILGLLETMDRVPNQAESAIRSMLTQHIAIPKNFAPKVLQIAELCCQCVNVMLDSVEKLFTNLTNATVIVGRIDELESQVDHIESELIEEIFASQMDGFDKILLRDLIKSIAQTSDRAENVGDRIRIIAAKRRV